jgi:hypothetical protein
MGRAAAMFAAVFTALHPPDAAIPPECQTVVSRSARPVGKRRENAMAVGQVECVVGYSTEGWVIISRVDSSVLETLLKFLAE